LLAFLSRHGYLEETPGAAIPVVVDGDAR